MLLVPKEIVFDDVSASNKDKNSSDLVLRNTGDSILIYKVKTNYPNEFSIHGGQKQGFLQIGEEVACNVVWNTSSKSNGKEMEDGMFLIEEAALTDDEYKLCSAEKNQRMIWTRVPSEKISRHTVHTNVASAVAKTKIISSTVTPTKTLPNPMTRQDVRDNNDNIGTSPSVIVPVPPLRASSNSKTSNKITENTEIDSGIGTDPRFPMYIEDHIHVQPSTLHLRESETDTTIGYIHLNNTGDASVAYRITSNVGVNIFTMANNTGVIYGHRETSIPIELAPRVVHGMSPPAYSKFTIELVEADAKSIQKLGNIDALWSHMLSSRGPPGAIVRRIIECVIEHFDRDPVIDAMASANAADGAVRFGSTVEIFGSGKRVAAPMKGEGVTNTTTHASNVNDEDATSFASSMGLDVNQINLPIGMPEIRGRLMDLLVKNVSRYDPLSKEEALELKSFKERITGDEWHACLQHARKERVRRLEDAASNVMRKFDGISSVNRQHPVENTGKELRVFPQPVKGDSGSRLDLKDVSRPLASPSSRHERHPIGATHGGMYETYQSSRSTLFGGADPMHGYSSQQPIYHEFSPNGVGSPIGNTGRSNGIGILSKGERMNTQMSMDDYSYSVSQGNSPQTTSTRMYQPVHSTTFQHSNPVSNVKDKTTSGKYSSGLGLGMSRGMSSSHTTNTNINFNDNIESERSNLLKSSSLRIDGAYAAAKLLMSQIPDNRIDHETSNSNLTPYVAQLMQALEKSKNSIDKLNDVFDDNNDTTAAIDASTVNVNELKEHPATAYGGGGAASSGSPFRFNGSANQISSRSPSLHQQNLHNSTRNSNMSDSHDTNMSMSMLDTGGTNINGYTNGQDPLSMSINSLASSAHTLEYDSNSTPLRHPNSHFPTSSNGKPLYHKVGGGENVSYPYVRNSLGSHKSAGYGFSNGGTRLPDASHYNDHTAMSMSGTTPINVSYSPQHSTIYSNVMHNISTHNTNSNTYGSPPRYRSNGSPSNPNDYSPSYANHTLSSAQKQIEENYIKSRLSNPNQNGSRNTNNSNNNIAYDTLKHGSQHNIGPLDTDLMGEMPVPGVSNAYRSSRYASHQSSISGHKAGVYNTEVLEMMNERARCEAGQLAIRRICVAPGPLVKAFEEFPIRVDSEKNCIDVVWREDRAPMSPRIPASSIKYNLERTSNTLRRERFNFHELYAGPGAVHRLDEKVRLWTRQSIQTGRDLNLICTSCGEAVLQTGMTPPLAMALGDRGHAGIVPAIVEEAFNFLAERVLQNNPPSHFFTYKSIAQAATSAVASRQEGLFKVTMGAVLIRDQNIMDLLGGSEHLLSGMPAYMSKYGGEGEKSPILVRNSSGRYVLNGVRQIQMRSPADLERVMGILLGKRFAIRDLQRVLEHHAAKDSKQSSDTMADNQYSTVKLEEQIRHLHRLDGTKLLNGILIDSPHIADNEVTQVVTINITKSATGFGQSATGLPVRGASRTVTSTFTVICPAGDDWQYPTHEMCKFLEGLSVYPETPTPSLLHSSPIAQMLLGPGSPPSDHIIIGSIVRNYTSKQKNKSGSSSKEGKVGINMVMNALNTFRNIAM